MAGLPCWQLSLRAWLLCFGRKLNGGLDGVIRESKWDRPF